MGNESIYVNEHGDCRLHRSGFAWLAVLSLMAWALQRRLYRLAALALAYGFALPLLLAAVPIDASFYLPLWLLQSLLLGFICNPLHQRWLLRSGWCLDAQSGNARTKVANSLAVTEGGTR